MSMTEHTFQCGLSSTDGFTVCSSDSPCVRPSYNDGITKRKPIEIMIASTKRKQNCLDCQRCDGFACLRFDIWLDGKIKVGKGCKSSSVKSSKDLNYVPVMVYGKRYCRHFRRRIEKLANTVKDFPCFIDCKGNLVMPSTFK